MVTHDLERRNAARGSDSRTTLRVGWLSVSDENAIGLSGADDSENVGSITLESRHIREVNVELNQPR